MVLKSLVHLFEVMMGSSFLYSHHSLHKYIIDGELIEDSEKSDLVLTKEQLNSELRDLLNVAFNFATSSSPLNPDPFISDQ
jgi:hypothetical protein